MRYGQGWYEEPSEKWVDVTEMSAVAGEMWVEPSEKWADAFEMLKLGKCEWRRLWVEV